MSLLSGSGNSIRCLIANFQRNQLFFRSSRSVITASGVDQTPEKENVRTQWRKKNKSYSEVIEVTDGTAKQRKTKLKKYDASVLTMKLPAEESAERHGNALSSGFQIEEVPEEQDYAINSARLEEIEEVLPDYHEDVAEPFHGPEEISVEETKKKGSSKKADDAQAKESLVAARIRREKARRETCLAVLDVCSTQNHYTSALTYFRAYRRREKSRGTVFSPEESRELYNALLRCLAKKGDMEQIKVALRMMREDQTKPDIKTFAYCFESLGRQNAHRPSPDCVETSRILVSDLPTYGFELQSMFRERNFMADEREMTVAGIHLSEPSFVPVYEPLDTRYQCELVNSLNDRCIEGEVYSAISGVLDRSRIKELIEEQTEAELSGSLRVKSVAKDEDHEVSAATKKTLDDLEKTWERVIRNILERQIRLMKFTYGQQDPVQPRVKSAMIYPFISAVPISEVTNLVLQQAHHLLSGSNSFSPPLQSLITDLGTKFFQVFTRNRKTNSKLNEKIKKFHELYINRLQDPQTDKACNSREMWEEIQLENMTGPDVCVPSKMWPEWVIAGIGEFLYKIILDDMKFNAKRHPHEAAELVPAFYIVYRQKGERYSRELKVHPLLMALYSEAVSRDLTFDCNVLPMVVPPLPWLTPRTGGYLTTDSFFFRSYRADAAIRSGKLSRLSSEQLYPTMDSLNALGLTPWKINGRILDIIIDIFNKKGNEELGIALHPSTIPPPSAEMSSGATPAERHQLFREHMLYKQKKQELLSLWCSALFTLSIANHFRDRVLWFPHDMDFRGRVYPMPPYLNHLQCDYGRALLKFAKGKPLGENGLRWLKLHAINLTGNMKREPIAKRLEYVESIVDELVDCAENPFTGSKWWQKSDDPWQTLACCMELADALKSPDPKKFISHLPIHQDGSCNGLQHYAALGRDTIGARSVNLAAAKSPGDVYSDVAALVERQRIFDAEDGNEVAQVLKGHVSRKVIKQTVMTIVYGVTRFGARLQILKQLKDLEDFPKEYLGPASSYLTLKTFDCIREMFTSAKEIQDWFNECAKVISNDCSQHIEWVTPLGLPVVQTYARDVRLEKPNAVKQKNAFAPNFVHSLDSCHMMMTALYCQRAGISFASVHDCFWTHPCTVETMNKICRESFVSLHSQPILENLSKSFEKAYEEPMKRLLAKTDNSTKANVFSRVPARGDFDLEEVKRSTYFFS